MNAIRKIIFGAIILSLTACGSSAKFPVSSVLPASEITVEMKQDKNKNFVIEVTGKNMASAERLDPPKKIYVVWIVTDKNGTKNIGQLINKNAKKTYLKTSTPFKVNEIFITAEEMGNISYPSGVEISRIDFSKI